MPASLSPPSPKSCWPSVKELRRRNRFNANQAGLLFQQRISPGYEAACRPLKHKPSCSAVSTKLPQHPGAPQDRKPAQPRAERPAQSTFHFLCKTNKTLSFAA
ncbi:UNVERIFIED_CONTAM: hypothetical protein K2H54_040816 [Gekko kuhli]